MNEDRIDYEPPSIRQGVYWGRRTGRVHADVERKFTDCNQVKTDDLEGYGQAPVDRVFPTMWLPIKARLWLMSVDWFGVVRAIVMAVCIGSICAAFWPVMGRFVGGVVTILLP